MRRILLVSQDQILIRTVQQTMDEHEILISAAPVSGDFEYVLLDADLATASFASLHQARHNAIIIIADATQQAQCAYYLQEGAADYLLKPLYPELLRKRLNQMAELQSLRFAKVEFMRFATFELRNPLQNAKIYLDLILSAPHTHMALEGLTDEQGKVVRIIRDNAKRFEAILQDLHDYAEIGARAFYVEPEAIEVEAMIQYATIPYEIVCADRGQYLSYEIQGELPRIMGDEKRLVQALSTLINNAHKFTPDGGNITIYAQHEGDYVYFAVRDTGVGINEDDKRRLLDEQYVLSIVQNSPDRLETGLGLYITRHIIEEHHGRIWVESQVGQGTTFYFTIPAEPNA